MISYFVKITHIFCKGFTNFQAALYIQNITFHEQNKTFD